MEGGEDLKRLFHPLSAIPLLAAAALYFRSFAGWNTMSGDFLRYGYFCVLLLAVLWAVWAWRVFRESGAGLRDFWRRRGSGVLLCFAVAGSAIALQTPFFRVLQDETALLSVSRSMAVERTVANVTMGVVADGAFRPTVVEIPYRPLLFSFLTSLLHNLTGFRPENAFALNFLLFTAFLFIVYHEVRRVTMSDAWAAAAIFLTAAQPAVAQAAASGGFDLLAAVLLVASLAGARAYSKNPTHARIGFLWLTLLLLAHTRYESALFLFLVPSVMALCGALDGRALSRGTVFLLACTPLVLYAAYAPRVLLKDGLGVEAAGPVFSVEYLLPNLAAWGRAFFVPGRGSFSAVIDWLGAAGLAWAAPVFFRKTGRDAWAKTAMAAATALCAVYFFYQWGRADHPSANRFFILHATAFSLGAAALLWRSGFLRKKGAVVLAAACIAFVSQQAVSIRFPGEIQLLPEEFRKVRDFLDDRAKGGRDFIVVSTRPGMYAALGYGSADFKNTADSPTVYHALRRHEVRDVFVVQSLFYARPGDTTGQTLDSRFALEPLADLPVDGRTFVRLSRAVLPGSP